MKENEVSDFIIMIRSGLLQPRNEVVRGAKLLDG
jgi:hypothetical protein